MTDAMASAFELAARCLSQSTGMSETEARGTLRFAMKDAGLRIELLTPAKARVLLQRVVPRHLTARGQTDAQAACDAAAAALAAQEAVRPSVPAPDEVFRRVRANLGRKP